MKHNLKKLFVWMLTAAMLLTMMPAMAITVSAASGTTGEVGWSYDTGSATLTISGNGAMGNEVSNNLPWKDYVSQIKKIVIASGVTAIGDQVFYDHTALTEIQIADTVTSIGKWAINGCTSLKSITIPASVMSIGNYAFARSTSLSRITFLGTTSPTFDQWNSPFNNLSSIEVLVSADYSSNSFCGITVTNGNMVNVSVSPTEGGTVIVDKAIAASGETVTVTVAPAEEYVVDSLDVTGGATGLTSGNNGTYTFTMPANDVTIQATFKAKPAPHTHALHAEGSNATWTPITSLANINGAGNYYLADNITSTSSWTVSSNINLCLNGKTLEFTASSGRYITVNSGASLSICDCSAGQGGCVHTNKGSYTIYNNGTVNLYSGTIDYTAPNSWTATIENNTGAIFNMYGGMLNSISRTIHNKGTVNIFAGTVTAKNDAIQQNDGELTISGGTVTTADTSTWATLNFYGGTLNINGGKVTHGNGGMPVHVPSNGNGIVNISGGTITTSGKNDTLYLLSANVDVNITGGSITNTYGSVSYSSTDGQRYGWAIDVIHVKSLTISGAPVIDSIYLAKDKTITVGEDGLTNATPIPVFCRTMPSPVTGENSADYSSKFVPKENYAGTYVIRNSTDNVVWFTQEATITYSDGVNGVAFAAQTYPTYRGAVTPAFVGTPSREGYRFDGWSKDIAETVTGSVTYTAKWKINQYTITFANTGDSEIAAITQDYGTPINKPANPVWEGHTFSAWSIEIPDTMPAENMTIKAIWDVNTYALSWVVDGETTTNNVAFGAAIVKPADPKKEGYTFDGWDQAIPATMPAQPLTFVAKWTINQYTITFDSNGGSAVASITQDYGTPVTAPTAPTKGDYIFAGWLPRIPDAMPAENLTLVAQWTLIPDNIVTPTTGGSVPVDDPNPAAGETVTITPVPESGMQVDTVTVVDASGEPLTLRDNGDGSYSFVQPEGIVTISVTFKAIPRETATLWLPVLARLYMTTNPITAIAGEGGAISDEGVVQVKYGRNAVYTITADEGYIIADVLVNGKSVGAVSEYTFKKVRRPQVIEVIFAVDPDAVVEEPIEEPVEEPADDIADPMYSYEQP